jgi:integrase
MPRSRSKENQGLPLGWRHIHGAYYYSVPRGLEPAWGGKKLFRLGTQLSEAYKVWAAKLEHSANVKTIAQLLDRYALEVIPTKAAASQASNQNQLKKLRAVFGTMPLHPFTPQLVYQYVDTRSQKKKDPETGNITGGKIAAHREIEVLSHAYTKAVQWGYIDRHPFKDQIRLEGEKPRTRYIEDWEILEALRLVPHRKNGSVLVIQAYIRVKLLTGLAQADLLRLRTDEHIKPDGIHNQRHKTAGTTGKKTIYQWSPELRAAVDTALKARPARDSTFLFCNGRGEGYINEDVGRASGWKSMWQRFMARVLEETKVTEPFTEHDLRAKVASDAPSLEQAQALLAHADSRTTDRVYRRKAEIVTPGRLPKGAERADGKA